MNSLTRPEITAEAAQRLVASALDHARSNGWQIAVAVVDPHGVLAAFGRSDHVARPSVEFAIDKAYTAATLRKSSQAFGERMASSPTLALGLSTRARLMAWGGGVAGIGVSGVQDFEDVACAQAVIAAVGLTAG